MNDDYFMKISTEKKTVMKYLSKAYFNVAVLSCKSSQVNCSSFYTMIMPFSPWDLHLFGLKGIKKTELLFPFCVLHTFFSQSSGAFCLTALISTPNIRLHYVAESLLMLSLSTKPSGPTMATLTRSSYLPRW